MLCLHETSQSKDVCEFTITTVSEILFPVKSTNGRYTRIPKETADEVLIRLFKKFGSGDNAQDCDFIDLFSDLFARGIVCAYNTAAREDSLNIVTLFHFTKIISRLSNSNESTKRLLVQELGVFSALHDSIQTCLLYYQHQRKYEKSLGDIVYSIVTASAASITFLTNQLQHVEYAIEYGCVADLILCLENFELDLTKIDEN